MRQRPPPPRPASTTDRPSPPAGAPPAPRELQCATIICPKMTLHIHAQTNAGPANRKPSLDVWNIRQGSMWLKPAANDERSS